MTNEKRARNCARCKWRKSQEYFMGYSFDYRTCPCLCKQNKIYSQADRLRIRKAVITYRDLKEEGM